LKVTVKIGIVQISFECTLEEAIKILEAIIKILPDKVLKNG
jgi:hypothetical protein